MNAYTPMQALAKVRRELWWVIRVVGSVEANLHGNSKIWGDVVEVGKVLRETVKEVERIISRGRDEEQNLTNQRPGADLALKAQLAKARQAVADVLIEREDGPSNK